MRKIDAPTASRDGTVRIKLSTPGDYAEADESLVVNYAQIVAVRIATERQRQIASARARTSFKKIAAQPGRRARKVRYLAVRTEASAPAANQSRTASAAVKAAASIMIWDTQTQEIVGNNVYDVGREPREGSLTRFETYTADYVGDGL